MRRKKMSDIEEIEYLITGLTSEEREKERLEWEERRNQERVRYEAERCCIHCGVEINPEYDDSSDGWCRDCGKPVCGDCIKKGCCGRIPARI